MMFPGISGVQMALLGLAVGFVLGTAGTGIIVHKIDNARYDRLVASYATAHAKASKDELAAKTAFDAKLDAVNRQIADLTTQLGAARAAHSAALHQALAAEGKKNAPLARCLALKLPADVLRRLPH